MPESQFLGVIRIWAALAWADGVVQPTEAAAMRRLIDAADLDPVDQKRALGFLDQKVELDTSNLETYTDDVRRGIYRAACRLAAVDRDVAEVERNFLARLRDGLGIAEAVAADIESHILK